MSQNEVFDVAIIGAGPAGLAAGLYTSRDRYSTLLLEKSGLPGGQIMLTERVENYPGWESISGPDLVGHMTRQVENFGTTIRTGQEVTALRRLDNSLLEIQTNDGENTFRTRALILAPGSGYRQLGLPGENELRQVGKVSYCATCDGAFYRDKTVLTVGGGNTAVEDTIYLAEHFTKKTILVHRRKEFRAQQVLIEEMHEKAAKHNIEIKTPFVLERIVGNAQGTEIDHVEIRNLESDQIEHLKVDGVFMFVGMVPNTRFLEGFVALTDQGYIKCDPAGLRTNVPGVFVVGDCRADATMQLATAVGDGVTAAMMLKHYFRDPQWWTMGRTGAAGAGW